MANYLFKRGMLKKASKRLCILGGSLEQMSKLRTQLLKVV